MNALTGDTTRTADVPSPQGSPVEGDEEGSVKSRSLLLLEKLGKQREKGAELVELQESVGFLEARNEELQEEVANLR